MTRFFARTLSANRFRSSSEESISTCGAKRKRSTPANFVPFTAAAAVRFSIVSRSINGSPPSDPLPTTPGQAALCNLGKLFVVADAFIVANLDLQVKKRFELKTNLSTQADRCAVGSGRTAAGLGIKAILRGDDNKARHRIPHTHSHE